LIRDQVLIKVGAYTTLYDMYWSAFCLRKNYS